MSRAERDLRAPRLAKAVLIRALPPADRRFAMADLEEELERRGERDGVRRARWWFRRQVVASLAPTLWARLTASLRSPDMSDRADSGPRPEPRSGWRSAPQLFWSDLRCSLRGLRRTPITVTVTVLSLGLGIGAVTSALALVDRFLFPPPAGLESPEQLVTLYTAADDGDRYGISSYPDYLSVATSIDSLEQVAAASIRSLALDGESAPVPLLAEEVTGNYFTVTGIRPVVGRGLTNEEARVGGAARVVVLGHRIWRRRFDADPEIVGRTLRIDGNSFVVIGVAPSGVMSRRVPLQPDAWIPLGIPDSGPRGRAERFEQRDNRTLVLIGRMKEGVTTEQVQVEADLLASQLREEYPASWEDENGVARALTVVPERSSRINPRARRLVAAIASFFVAAAGLILLIACGNVASLFLARAAGRSREMAVRLSLGASRKRLAALILTEGLIPGALSGLVGLLVAWIVARSVSRWSLPLNLPIRLDVGLDLRVLAIGFLLSLGASLVFGLGPALEGSRISLTSSLAGSSTIAGRLGRGRLRSLMVVGQCAAAVVLLVGASLFLRALQTAVAVDLGFDPDRVAIASKSLDPEFSPQRVVQWYRELRRELAAAPDVEQVEIARGVELTLFQLAAKVDVEVAGADWGDEDQRPEVFSNAVTPGYLEMLDVPLVAGRSLRESDNEDAAAVAVVNETFADRFWPGREPIGQTFVAARSRLSSWTGHEEPEPRSYRVVGVARDGKYMDFDDGPLPYFWTSLYQDYSQRVAILVKGRSDVASAVSALQAGLSLAPGELRRVPPSPLVDQISIQFIHLRLASKVLGWGGLFGLFLAALGIYGVVAVAASERRREIAIRIAVGAERSRLVRTVVRDGMMLAASGLGAGLLVAVLAARGVRSVLAGVSPLDPLALGGGVSLLLVVTVLAALAPAWRAVRLDPMTTLRQE